MRYTFIFSVAAVGHSSMPFSLSELVAMSLALRDACLGIIELAHPDTRPALKEDYRAAFQVFEPVTP